MQKLLPVLLGCGSAVLVSLPLPAKAQEYQGCFMVSGSGRLLDLSALCSGDAAAVPSVYSYSPQQSRQAFTLTTAEEQDLEASYAETYCHARQRGISHSVANSMGLDGFARMIADRYPDPAQASQALSALSANFAKHSVERAEGLCPTLFGNDKDPNARPVSSSTDSHHTSQY